MSSSNARFRLCLLSLSAALIVSAPGARGATAAFDSQADPVYTTWDPGDNGGTGWGGGWTFRDQANTILTVTDAQHGWFVANSTNNDNTTGDSNGDGDINSPSTSKAWGLYSNAAAKDMYAIRPFDGALSAGQILKFDLDNGNIATSQVVGFRLLTNAADINSRDWEFRFVGGATDYTIVNSAGTANDTLIPFTREGIHVELTLTSATAYSVTMTRLVNNQIVTQTGSFVTTAPIVALALKNQEAGSGAAADAYFNNLVLTAVPEPSLAGLAIAGLLAGIARKAKRA